MGPYGEVRTFLSWFVRMQPLALAMGCEAAHACGLTVTRQGFVGRWGFMVLSHRVVLFGGESSLSRRSQMSILVRMGYMGSTPRQRRFLVHGWDAPCLGARFFYECGP